ncbi:unnamed protein product [Thelazia callipaeda]|uniref:Vicilin-like seed storage protein At2g18540 n=1 Tax=Thelazia callipaeda TaxID=103827 RepID=A0A0N5D3D0_THECL|nr:unnamed protein product [Thelazia callipaeda]
MAKNNSRQCNEEIKRKCIKRSKENAEEARVKIDKTEEKRREKKYEVEKLYRQGNSAKNMASETSEINEETKTYVENTMDEEKWRNNERATESMNERKQSFIERKKLDKIRRGEEENETRESRTSDRGDEVTRVYKKMDGTKKGRNKEYDVSQHREEVKVESMMEREKLEDITECVNFEMNNELAKRGIKFVQELGERDLLLISLQDLRG